MIAGTHNANSFRQLKAIQFTENEPAGVGG